jgi:non-canonical purine NTP pyrophosphatase (RdgB/HAM1 family)
MTLQFITGNTHKFVEASAMLPDLEQLDIELDEIQSLDPKEIIEHKLRAALLEHNGAFIVEDTSLCIASLGGMPGPLVKWFLKSVGADGIAQMARAAKKVDDKTARDATTLDEAADVEAVVHAEAVCMIGYADERGDITFFEGRVPGRIVLPRGEHGFGWDPIFQPDGHDGTYAELPEDVKNQISHRKLAFERLREHLFKHA